MPFNLRDLVDPYENQAVPSKPDSWSELDAEMQKQKALGPQPDPGPANVPAPSTEPNTWIKRMEQIRPNRYFESESNNSTWMPKELEGVPRNSPVWTMPGEKKPWGPAERPAPEGQQPTDNPTPDYVPTALRRFQTEGGAGYTMEEIPGSYIGPFLNDLEKSTGVKINTVQGLAERNQRGLPGSDPNKPSAHSSRDGARAVDVNPDSNAVGTAGQFDPVILASVLARHPAIETIRGDPMHFQVRRSYLGVPAPQQPGGDIKMAGMGELVDPEDGRVVNAAEAAPAQRVVRTRAVEAASGGGGSQNPAPASSWDQFGQDAIRRNALMSFAAQMLTPSYYPMGGLGTAIGQAGESMGATSAALQKQLGTEMSADEKAAENEANRQSREQNAETAASSRESVANIRGQFSLDRAHIALQKAPASVYVKYYDQARKTVENNIGNLTMDDATKTALIRQKAAELYQAAVELGLEKGGGEGIGQGQSSATGTAGGQNSGGTPGQKTGSGNQGNSGNKMTWEQFRANPQSEALLADPVARERLFKERSDFRSRYAGERAASDPYSLSGALP